ncbi:DIS3-like exonuclease 2, partial [Mytilus californianus]|uniref:DIS3-like exonuclease 2 n=1 Tax=Mytilus californianus TaxID=6549 RepID=UPI0022453F91
RHYEICCLAVHRSFIYSKLQGFVEDPEREWTEEELPTLSDGYLISQIKDTVLNLQKIAKNLRKARFDKGALHLDQVKLQFSLDKDTGMPNGYSVYKQKDSNRLVEEFMLLANIAVADKIKKHFPDKALLRRHPKPQSKMVDELVEWSTNVGFPIDATSAGTIQKSLWRYADSDDISVARMQVLINRCCKVMQKAKYFCIGCIDDEELYRHYALNIPLYTHFTSPIRRYADVMVHRTLAAALDNCELSEKSTVAIKSIAENCNDRKIHGKQASDLSSELFFAVFVKTTGPFEEKGMVMGVLDKAFDVVLLNVGVKKRVYCDQLDIKNTLYKKEGNNPVLTLYWKPTEENDTGAIQNISLFTKVTCILRPGESPLKWTAIIKSPKS